MQNCSKDSLAGAKSIRSNAKTAITPVLILCDNSGSMKKYVDIVNQCLVTLIHDLKAHPVRSHQIDLHIVSFHTDYEDILPFTMVDRIDMSQLKKVEQTEWATYLGAALLKAVKELADEKAALKKARVTYAQPNLIVISDGYPEEEHKDVTLAGIKAVQDKITRERWNCIPIFIGHDFKDNIMDEICVPDTNGKKDFIRFDSMDKKKDIIDAFAFASMSIDAVGAKTGNTTYTQMSTNELKKKIFEHEKRRKAIKPNGQQQKKSFFDSLRF